MSLVSCLSDAFLIEYLLTSKFVFFLRLVVPSAVEDVPLAVLVVRFRRAPSGSKARLRVKPSATGSTMTTLVPEVRRRPASSSIDEESDDAVFFNTGRVARVSDGMPSVDDRCCAEACDDGPGPARDDAGNVLLVGVVADEDGDDVDGCVLITEASAKTLRGLRLLA